MAVYKRRYDPYRGRLTERWRRWSVLTRYALRDLFASRFFLGFFLACWVPVLFFSAYVFTVNSEVVRSLLSVLSRSLHFRVDASFFLRAIQTQDFFAFLLATWAGPTLVAGDLTNGALPLFLSRPFRRGEYLWGKFAVLGVLLSSITWIATLALFFLEAGLSPEPWLGAHRWLLGPIVWCPVVWIVLLGMVALAASAWVRWRMVAMGAIFGLFLIPAGLGDALNAILGTRWGELLNLGALFHEILEASFREPVTALPPTGAPVPLWAAWGTLAVVSAAALALLVKRLRAFEVVRG